MINVAQTGASVRANANGTQEVRFGIYLPGITFNKGYRLKVRVIHEADQFIRGIEPVDFWMNWQNGSSFDFWETVIVLSVPPAPAGGNPGHFGQPGRYLYRYQLLRGNREVTSWFADPFGRDTGLGTLSAFAAGLPAPPFPWTDANFRVPDVDAMVVYEMNVREFNRDFSGVILQLDYLLELGVNVLELMPVTNVKEDVEWGYTPLGYFTPDERLGGPLGMKRLVDACHAKGIAVVVDAVYAHAHPEFAYNCVYDNAGESNPMMGYFAGEFFASQPGTDYRKQFTRDYFFEVNRYWLEEYHVDGFRYDYVPGMWDGPSGQGYADLVYRTYQHVKAQAPARFQGAAGGYSRIIQCAEHLPDPKGVISTTFSNSCWQNGLLDRARDMAKWNYVSANLAHLLDPEFLGYATEYRNPASGDSFPVAPFQYIESHDHKRFINVLGELGVADIAGQRYGDRTLFYKMQPYVIALYTGKGIPMLWQGQEFGENWGMPDSGLGRNLFERPLHWEYFYDAAGKALVRLHRTLGTLRQSHPALGSRGYFYYFNSGEHLQKGVIAFRREATLPNGQTERVIVLLNFSDQNAEVWVPFPVAGQWSERIDGTQPVVNAAQTDHWLPVTVPSNYGSIYMM
ncbi:MAG: alpha-amylase [Fibrella sp.]|nr:alpha-amylase [Armatimonadota bacterium]